ncbi:hypothetical protein H0H92_006577, partial [Tricholoma furcatifolium]
MLQMSSCRAQFLKQLPKFESDSKGPEKNGSNSNETIDMSIPMTMLPAVDVFSRANTPPSPAAAFERNEDDNVDSNSRWVEEFPGEAGSIYGTCKTSLNEFADRQKKDLRGPWAPFENEADWELAEWLLTSGVSQAKIETFLKLKLIREGKKPSFHNTRSLLKRVDELPSGPEWYCQALQLVGDQKDSQGNFRTEELEVWMRNPVKCVEHLLEDPSIGKNNGYVPRRVFRNANRTNREYSESSTSDWMWQMQASDIHAKRCHMLM